MSNDEIAKVLNELAGFLDMDEVQFKPRAFEKAAEVISAFEQEIPELYKEGGLKGIMRIPGVGVGIAERIEEFLKTGHIKDLDKLKKKYPVDYQQLRRVEGVGPKHIKKLYRDLGIRTLEDLENAAKKGKIRKLGHFGQKSEENILRGIDFVKSSGGRFVLGDILPLVRLIEERLGALKETKKVVVAGSIRRWKETIGDIDILVVSKKPRKVMDFFVKMPEVIDVHAHGETKSSVKLSKGIDVDLRVVEEKSFGAALNYFTGSKDHNVALRQLAIKKGYKLNEYGLYKGAKFVAGRNEEELYKALGFKQTFIPPEMRETKGEIEAALKGELPEIIGYKDLRGDLQTQTNWTDGAHSIEEMSLAAKKAGLEYIVITDHTKALAMTGGNDEKRLLKQWAEIDGLNKKGLGVKILKGAEVNILKDGSLDIDDKTLSQGDVIGAAVHTNFNMSKKDMTERIKRAMKNPNVDILFHPTGRLINKREAYELDMEEIIKTAKNSGTILEIDAYPDRLDLKDDHIRSAIEAGVKLSIDSDAHNKNHFGVLEFGVAQARRGWATKKDIINAWPAEKMLKSLKDAR
ncbi:DNA polymerase/3'-5' exonuclease PolX [Candidatus Parcubacteria bacterium]|nr:MAG: DNA polymerase/3'-5' exonuclease PolX [Candidatus Parcubacteria bacterium]